MTSTLRPAHLAQALKAIVLRELFKFSRQYGRLASALVRPLLWLAVFAACLAWRSSNRMTPMCRMTSTSSPG